MHEVEFLLRELFELHSHDLELDVLSFVLQRDVVAFHDFPPILISLILFGSVLAAHTIHTKQVFIY